MTGPTRRKLNAFIFNAHVAVDHMFEDMPPHRERAIRCEFLERMIVDLRRRGIALVSLREALKLATGSPGRLSRSRFMMATGTITKLPIPF